MKTTPFNLEAALAGKPVVYLMGGDLVFPVLEFHVFKAKVTHPIRIVYELGTEPKTETFTIEGALTKLSDYRRLAMLVEPRTVEWELKDVPLDAWYRARPGDGSDCYRIVSVSGLFKKVLLNGSWRNMVDLMSAWQYSRTPLDPTSWKPCEKEVEE